MRRCRAYVIALTVLVSSLTAGAYLTHEDLPVAVLRSLLIGFSPLIGLFVLLIVFSVLYSILLCSVVQVLAKEDEDSVPETDPKKRWHLAPHGASSLLPDYLSLKEHSPPAFSFLLTRY